MPLISMRIFQIKRIISSEKWFNHVVITFFFWKMTKLWVGRTTLNEGKKRMALRQKKYPTFFPDVKHGPMVSPGHTK